VLLQEETDNIFNQISVWAPRAGPAACVCLSVAAPLEQPLLEPHSRCQEQPAWAADLPPRPLWGLFAPPSLPSSLSPAACIPPPPPLQPSSWRAWSATSGSSSSARSSCATCTPAAAAPSSTARTRESLGPTCTASTVGRQGPAGAGARAGGRAGQGAAGQPGSRGRQRAAEDSSTRCLGTRRPPGWCLCCPAAPVGRLLLWPPALGLPPARRHSCCPAPRRRPGTLSAPSRPSARHQRSCLTPPPCPSQPPPSQAPAAAPAAITFPSVTACSLQAPTPPTPTPPPPLQACLHRRRAPRCRASSRSSASAPTGASSTRTRSLACSLSTARWALRPACRGTRPQRRHC
jgi:hypothetical protein